MGTPPSRMSNLLAGTAQQIPAPPVQVAVGIPAELLRRRPDVRQAEFQAAAQSASIGVTKAALYPAISLTGTFGFLSSDVGSFTLGDVFLWKSRTANFGPALQWNIFNYGQITNQVRVQDARLQELLVSYQNTVLTAQREVEDNLGGIFTLPGTRPIVGGKYRSGPALAGSGNIAIPAGHHRFHHRADGPAGVA